ncbi:MAG TPA: class I SAM-dependent methyltransferase [Bacteroidia bacterium]
MENINWQLVAAQLRKPHGEMADEIGKRMNESNAAMNRLLIKNIELKPGIEILEIGMGNGRFVSELFQKQTDIHYTGIDYSSEMVNAAKNENLHLGNKVSFLNLPIESLSSSETLYDIIFTVNTIYFWDEPNKTLAGIRSLLNPNGKLLIAFRPKSIMLEHPFTEFGFTLYSREDAIALLETGGFKVENVIEETDAASSSLGGQNLPLASIILQAIKE